MTYVVAHLLGPVLHAPQVDTGVLCASVSAYLLLGVMWTTAFWLVALFTPGVFAFNTVSTAKESMQGFNAFLL